MSEEEIRIPVGYKHQSGAAVVIHPTKDIAMPEAELDAAEVKKVEQSKDRLRVNHRKNLEKIDAINKENRETPIPCEPPPAEEYLRDAGELEEAE